MRPAWTSIPLVLAAVLALPLFSASPYMIAQSKSSGFDPVEEPEQFRPAADGSRPSPGNHPLPVVVEIIPLPVGIDGNAVAAAARAVENWNSVPGSAMRVTAVLPERGETNDGDWHSRYLNADGRNTIEFVTNDWNLIRPDNFIALANTHLDPATGRIIESDVFVNAEYFNWAVFAVEGHFPALEKEGLQDVEAILTHEMGHVLGIGHSQYSWATMFPEGGYANTQFRRLSNDDHQALRFLYPLTAADVPPPSIWAVSEGHFSDNDCGMSWLSLLSYNVYYDSSIFKEKPMIADIPYCLFGSGFSAPAFQDMEIEWGGIPLNIVMSSSYVGPNFVKATVTGTFLIPAGTYDFSVIQDPGGKDLLDQGLIVTIVGATMPVAVIQPSATLVQPGDCVILDGSASIIPGDTVSNRYRWWIEDNPVGAEGQLSNPVGSVTLMCVSAPGIYVVRLVVRDVNDNLFSVADQVLIRAEFSYRDSDGGTGDSSSYSCLGWIGPGADGKEIPLRSRLGALILLALPLAGTVIIRTCLRRRRS